jgi:hypothetical protein
MLSINPSSHPDRRIAFKRDGVPDVWQAGSQDGRKAIKQSRWPSILTAIEM